MPRCTVMVCEKNRGVPRDTVRRRDPAVSRMMWKSLLGERRVGGSDRGQRPIPEDTRIWVAPSNAILSQLCDGEIEAIGVRRPLPPSAPRS